MARLIYATPTSLDGYIADETGNLDWAAPDEEGLALIKDLLRPIGSYLYGRKMYETMAIWKTPDVIPGLASSWISGRAPFCEWNGLSSLSHTGLMPEGRGEWQLAACHDVDVKSPARSQR